EVLAVDLEAVESPLAERLADERPSVRPHALFGGTQIEHVPPRDLAGRAVRVAQEPVGMLALGAGARGGGERRPPELRAESGGMDLVDERLHVGAAAGELRVRGSPVALRDLPAVVERDPAEAELLHERNRRQNLLHRELRAQAIPRPRAPDRLEGVGRRRRERHALAEHEPAVEDERREGVAAMDRDERAQRRQPPAPPEYAPDRLAHPD